MSTTLCGLVTKLGLAGMAVDILMNKDPPMLDNGDLLEPRQSRKLRQLAPNFQDLFLRVCLHPMERLLLRSMSSETRSKIISSRMACLNPWFSMILF